MSYPRLGGAEGPVLRIKNLLPELQHLLALLVRADALGDRPSWGAFDDEDLAMLHGDLLDAADTLARHHNRLAEVIYRNVAHLKHQPVPKV
jgi:hypothetical protein